MTSHKGIIAAGVLGLVTGALLAAPAAQAGTITLNATDFTITYNTALVSPDLGTLSVSGDTIYFSPSLTATAPGGPASAFGSASGIVITAKPGVVFGSLELLETGSYQLANGGSVGAVGQLDAFNQNLAETLTQTKSNVVTSPLSTPGAPQDWAGSAFITDTSTPVLGGPAWLAGASSVNVAVQDTIYALANNHIDGSGATITKDLFSLTISPVSTPVPLPPSLWMALTGLGLVLVAGRRKSLAGAGRVSAYALLGLVLAAGVSAPAKASIVTLTGTTFDVQYDTATLGDYFTPTLSGDTLFFTPNNIVVNAVGGPAASLTATVSDLVIIPNAGYALGNVSIAAAGDYFINGGGSVSFTGSASAVSGPNNITAALILDPSLPLTINDGNYHDWQANGVIGWILPGAVTLSLTSTLGADGEPISQIQENYTGLEVTINATPVPVPTAFPMLLSGLGLAGWAAQSRRKAAARTT